MFLYNSGVTPVCSRRPLDCRSDQCVIWADNNVHTLQDTQ